MGAIVYNVAFDCVDAYELAGFWSRVVGHPMDPRDRPGDSTASVPLPTGMSLFFAEVPEAAEGRHRKNPVHVCLQPDGRRDDEVERYLGLGAKLLDDRRKPDGGGWVVFADPEGNEFCVLRSAAERAAMEDVPHE
ncbi:VOC family protein [Streptomyces sp. NBC_00237]|uniref:VOC family protein n=1 Tax=Streptomyces sp. NBC_00237 TaxID=2975687 RepID=UPI002259C2D2|nr:VOC family protein [Streptomyces sp. NBC_00237]MCX5200449.1 VOC family protein [Streptomyces sp. NBC_00237]